MGPCIAFVITRAFKQQCGYHLSPAVAQIYLFLLTVRVLLTWFRNINWCVLCGAVCFTFIVRSVNPPTHCDFFELPPTIVHSEPMETMPPPFSPIAHIHPHTPQVLRALPYAAQLH